jgi:hypothetical protein
MRDYSSRPTRIPTKARSLDSRGAHQKNQSGHQLAGHTFKLPKYILSPVRTIAGWGLIAVLLGGMALLVWFVVKANVHQLLPLKRSQTIVLVDPQPGNQSDIIVVQLAVASKKVIVYAVPAQAAAQLFSGYGEYQLSSIYPLLQLERKDKQYQAATLGAVLGVIVDAVIPVEQLGDKLSFIDLEKNPQRALTQAMQPLWWQSGATSNWKTRWQWLMYLERADLTWVALKSPETIGMFQFETAYSEFKDCSVAVINTTRVRGLARRISNELENSGLTVIRTAAEQTTEATSVVYYDESSPKCHQLVPYIQQALPKYREAQKDQSLVNRFRANLVVVLGTDLILPIDD